MRVLEIRRHSLTKKGPGRGSGSHLSQKGVALARRIGQTAGPFGRVSVSRVPCALETAIAMGFAADDMIPALGPDDASLFAEVGHHVRWSWEEPFVSHIAADRGCGPKMHLGSTLLHLADLHRSPQTSKIEPPPNRRSVSTSGRRMLIPGSGR